MKKFIHALVLAIFGFGCWFTWVILTLAPHIRRTDPSLPGFTIFCVSLRPVVIALPIFGAVYCVWVWFRRGQSSIMDGLFRSYDGGFGDSHASGDGCSLFAIALRGESSGGQVTFISRLTHACLSGWGAG